MTTQFALYTLEPSELSVHSALLIVNIPKMDKTRLLSIHKGITMLSPLFDKNSGLEIAIEANVTKDTTDNKPDSHLGKSLGRK